MRATRLGRARPRTRRSRRRELMPVILPFTQLMKRPRRHGLHSQQCPPCQPTPTRSPAFHAVTSAPTASTRPAISCPGMRGSVRPGNAPRTCTNASLWQTPHASTLTRTCRRPGLGDLTLDELERRAGLADLRSPSSSPCRAPDRRSSERPELTGGGQARGNRLRAPPRHAGAAPLCGQCAEVTTKLAAVAWPEATVTVAGTGGVGHEGVHARPAR